MTGLRRVLATLLMAALALLPLPGCAGAGVAAGGLASVALSIGASVGSYLLIREIS